MVSWELLKYTNLGNMLDFFLLTYRIWTRVNWSVEYVTFTPSYNWNLQDLLLNKRVVLIPFSLNHGLCVNCLNLPYQYCQKLLLGKQCCCSFFFIFFHSSFKETKKLIRWYMKKILNKISVSFGGIWRKSKTRSLFHLWTFVLFFGLRSFFSELIF